jgi:hypothetical protein
LARGTTTPTGPLVAVQPLAEVLQHALDDVADPEGQDHQAGGDQQAVAIGQVENGPGGVVRGLLLVGLADVLEFVEQFEGRQRQAAIDQPADRLADPHRPGLGRTPVPVGVEHRLQDPPGREARQADADPADQRPAQRPIGPGAQQALGALGPRRQVQRGQQDDGPQAQIDQPRAA